MTSGPIFSVDEFLDGCRAGLAETDPVRAIREVVKRAMTHPGAVADVLKPEMGGLSLLHHAPDLTVLHVVWAPGMRISPHNHGMWATIGIYTGQEDNTFYRRTVNDPRALVESGGKELRVGDVVTLGDKTIHAVANPVKVLTGAIHVYGGDFVNEPRSQWGPGLADERPFNMDEAQRQFADANRVWLEAFVR
jgi:predicted metal-dependent enzyme (double-stranded beta helix superfamily)